MRAWVAALLAFGPLLIAQPAAANWQSNNALIQGDTVQFSYMWGFAEQSFTNTTVSVTVTNDITNKIGGNGEVIDTYRITFGNQVIEKTEKHGPVTYTFEVIGTQTLRLEGIDRGFWGGYYGPIMQVSVVIPEPAPTESPSVSPSVSDTVSESVSPVLWDYIVDEGGILLAEAPSGQVFSEVVARYVAHDSECGLDVSEIVGAALIGSSSGTIPATNESFGDPCPGWYKKLVVSVQYSSVMITHPTVSPLTESAAPTTSPEVTPTPTPTPEPSPEPAPSPEPVQPEPTPEATPLETPTASSPTQSPEPVQPEPLTSSPPVEVSESQKPTALPIPSVQPTSEIPSPQPTQEPSEAPTEPTKEVIEIPEETESDTISGTVQTAVTEAIGAAVKAVGELVSAVTSAGLDMTPEQREEAQDVVVSAVIVSQVASAASVTARKIK
jgi:hypothetical protein